MTKTQIKYSLLLLIIIFSGIISFAQPNWNYTITGSNHTILIHNTIELSFDGVQISSGDYIGVFYDSLGVQACGGYISWQGNSTTMAAWGNQLGVADGFAQGEEFQWKIWLSSNQQEYSAEAIYNIASFPNEGNYVANGMSGLLSLIAVSPTLPSPQWHVDTTSLFHKIIVPNTASLTINNSPINFGDYIGVFYDSVGFSACGGYIMWSGFADTLIAFGNILNDNGFDNNELFNWKIWRASDQTELDASPTYNITNYNDSSFFIEVGLSGLHSLTVFTGPDIGIIELLNPQSSCYLLGASESIELLVVNNGDELIEELSLYISINNWDTIIYKSGLNIQLSDSLLINNLCSTDFSVSGDYIFSINISLAGDMNNENDSLFTIVHNYPLPVLSFIGLDTQYCSSSDATVTLFAQPSGGLFSGLNVLNNEFFLSNSDTSAIMYNYTDQATGCVNQISQQVVVYQSPEVDLGDDVIACISDTVILEIASNYASYEWSNGISQTNTLNVVLPGFYSVTVTALNNCVSSDIIQVSFNSIPLINIFGLSQSCIGDTVLLNAGEGYDFYQWSGINTTYSQTLSVTESGTYLCTVTYNSCSVSDSFAIVFQPTPIIKITGQYSACIGDEIILEVDSGFSYYVWSGNFINTPVFTVTQSGDYWVMVTNEYNCHSIDTFSITFFDLPIIYFGSVPKLCVGDSFLLHPGFAENYLWSNSSVDSSIIATEPGDYAVTITENTCSVSDVITIHFFSLPNVSFNYSILFNTITFVNNSDIAESYTWQFGDFASSNSFEPIHIFNQTGEYIIQLTADNFCGSNSFSDTIIISNINDNLPFHLPVFYPNPGNGIFNIDFPVINENYFLLTVYDEIGCEVFSNHNIFLNSFEHNLKLDLSFLSSGTYYAIWVTDDETFYNKLFIIR